MSNWVAGAVMLVVAGCQSEPDINTGGCTTSATVIPADAVDPAGPSGAAMFAQAQGVWTGSVTWLDADASLVTLGHVAGSTVATVLVSNPGETRKVVARSSGEFGCSSHTEVDVAVVLQTQDGVLNEYRRLPLRSSFGGTRSGVTFDFKGEPPSGTLSVTPSADLKIIFFDFSIGFDTSATGGLRVSLERSTKEFRSLQMVPLAQFEANRSN
ncbi:MAG TPA: hypothetical protein VFH73_29280 [Polyangia bacterium]|jgi:hypothetical protein|nr:hypothetical protein [Polyangia bacterium]